MACATTSRRRSLLGVTTLVALGGGLLSGCGGGGEEQEILSGFFRAANYDDRGTMGNVSMVSFDAREQGNVTGVSVQSVSEERRRPLRMRELADELAAAREAEQTHAEEMKTFQDENAEAVVRIITAERDEEDVASGDQEVQELWTQYRDTSAEHSAAVSEAEQALSAESVVAVRSATGPETTIDVRSLPGELVSKDVVFTASVSLDGAEEERTMTAILEKAVVGEGENMIDGRWMITSLE